MEFESLDGYRLIHTSYGSILREHRVQLGLTQKQVAERSKMPLQSYQRFESNERNIMTASFQMACRVLETLEMDAYAFYRGDYVLSEPIIPSQEGLRYKHSGNLVNEDVGN